jgi:uncharacterized cupredoxin-like copper-binding protein
MAQRKAKGETMRPRIATGPFLGLALAALLSGCGGTAEEPASNELQIEATEYAFEPDTVSVPAGEEVTVTLDNQGQLLHEWTIIEQGTTLEDTASFREELVYFETESAPGEANTATFTAPEPGSYQVVCAQPGHIEQGMTATLESVAAD